MNRTIAHRLLLALSLSLSVAPGLVGVARADADRDFRAKCGACHGADGKGDTQQGKKMKIGDMTSKAWQKQFTDAQMNEAIANGFKRDKDGVSQEMKGFKDRLQPDQINALVARVRGFAK